MPRTLRASQAGIDRAKRALRRLGWTQKDLTVDPLVASWATINGFFNGKAISHHIFKEICFHLELDWQDIYQPLEEAPDQPPASAPRPAAAPPPPQPAETALRSAVQRQAAAAREALTPRILERIPRAVVREKYLPAIASGLSGNPPRVIPLVGPAGYGKSTILGDIYDELIQSETPWVGLVLCSTLSTSVGFFGFTSYSCVAATFAMPNLPPVDRLTHPSSMQLAPLEAAFGNSLCGTSRRIADVVEQLVAGYGRGVLLIDTLDLVISPTFVSSFNVILRQLLDQGVTVVFTCRDHEYSDYLEPTRERLAGLSQSIDRYSVPNFTTAEIRAAAEQFFHQLASSTIEQGRAFANKILSLSADNRSLQDIIQNPLLLALLCELFAKEGNVPPDLTVSKLYQRYWQEKIAYSRVDQSHFAPLAIDKDNLCLSIARTLFELSQSSLCESLYRDEIDIEFTEAVTTAYNALLSEGVIEQLPSQKIHFFHQTLMEYAIAYWLTRHSARAQRDQWLETLKRSDAAQFGTHWYPVLRQYLTILETDDEFEQLVEHLGSSNLAIFGTIALAAASRDRPSALLKLLPSALALGEAYQKRLRLALESAPRQLTEEIWFAMVQLLEQGSHATAINTARTMNALAMRWWNALGPRLGDAIGAVNRRVDHPNQPHPVEDRRIILGWLLQDCLSNLTTHPHNGLFAVLRAHYPAFGSGTCAKIVQLHDSADRPLAEQRELLSIMLRCSVPDDKALHAQIISFLVRLLSNGVAVGSEGIWQSWLDVLHQSDLPGWDVLQAKAIGRCAAKDDQLLQRVAQDLLRPDNREPRRNAIALSEAIRRGAADSVAQQITALPIESLPSASFNVLASILKTQGGAFSSDHQEAIAQKLQPFAQARAERLRSAFDTLANDSLTARQTLIQLVQELPPEQQREHQGSLLRLLPIEQHPSIDTLDKKAQLFLLKLYREQAQTSPSAAQQILTAVRSRFKDVAVSASQDLEQVLGNSVSVSQLTDLLRSPYVGVRVNGLRAITHLTKQGRQLQAAELTAICVALIEEENQAVIRSLSQVAANWVQLHRQVPPSVAEAVGSSISRLVNQGTLDGGSARSLISALKAIAQSLGTGDVLELDPTVVMALNGWIANLLTQIDLIRVINSESEVIALLSAAHRLDKTLLAQLVHQECSVLAQHRWFRNIGAIIKAIRRVEGSHSTLFDDILASDWCAPEVESVVLEVKGV